MRMRNDVLKGAAFESDRSIPYAPLLDLLRAFAGSSSPARFEHVFAAAAPELVALFPELRATLPGVTPSAAATCPIGTSLAPAGSWS